MKAGRFATLLIFALGVTTASARYCKHKLDVVVALDGSDSISKPDFTKLKNAAIRMARDLGLGSNSQRLGALVFSSSVTNVIIPSSSYSLFKSKISRIKQPSGGTATHLGIKSMQSMFKRYGRSGARKVGIVITDGRSKKGSLTKIAASGARRDGITMFAVGVGSKTLNKELQAIASSRSNVLRLANFKVMKNKLRSLVRKICGVCKPKVDVMAVLDGSGSISSSDFVTLKNAAIQVARDLNLGVNGQQFGALVYGSKVTKVVPLSTCFYGIKARISRISKPSGTTATDKGIRVMTKLFRSKGRRRARKIGIVITDGKSNSLSRTRRAVRKARRAGITLFAVGVGPSINRKELRAIASSSSRVLYLANFRSLKAELKSVVRRMCREKRPCARSRQRGR